MSSPEDRAVAAAASLDLSACASLFDEVMRPVEGLFVRPEPRRTVRALVGGLLSSVERKNGWWLAERAGHRGPDAMQRLLTSVVWDHDRARDSVRSLVADRLGHPDGVLIVDETGFLKKGSCSVGVGRQYTGTAGRIENSQVAVFLTYASPRGRALVDRRLYLPRTSWCEAPERRAAAGVPDDVTFATKPELAQQMVAAALDAGMPVGWVTGDEVYGDNTAFRAFLRDRRVGYVLAVGCDTRVTLHARRDRADRLATTLPDRCWQRYSAGQGAKGPRDYDWAWVELAEGSPDRWLLVRRSPTTGELAYYLAWAATPQPLTTLVRVAGSRWAIEETFQAAKSQVGLDHYQVRRWIPWHRFITLAMLALAFLAVLATSTNAAHDDPDSGHHDGASPPPYLPDPRRPIPYTLAELRHLLGHLILNPVLDIAHLLHWSTWRRRHQARARHCHYRRRLNADP